MLYAKSTCLNFHILVMTCLLISRTEFSRILRSVPVIVLGMPKTGTTSLQHYFSCSGLRASHYWCNGRLCGPCFLDFIGAIAEEDFFQKWKTHNLNSFEFLINETVALELLYNACGKYGAYTEIGHDSSTNCIFPQITYLETLVAVLPSACYILNTRDLTNWLRSAHGWHNWTSRMSNACPLDTADEAGILNWVTSHLQHVRSVMKRLECAIEVNIEDPSAGQQLEHFSQTQKLHVGGITYLDGNLS